MANIVRSRYVLAAMWLLVISMGPCLSDESDGKASSAMVFDVGSVLPVLCYSSSPAFIFLRRKVDDTAVVALTFDGAERELLHLSGMVSPTSLSCSSDGSTIAVLRENPPKSVDLFLLQSGMLSENRLDRWPINAMRGRWSL